MERKPEMEKNICNNCGKEFYDWGQHDFCTRECLAAHINKARAKTKVMDSQEID